MRRITSLIVALLLVMWCGSAMALDETACTDGRFDAPDQECIGLLEPCDMGHFDGDQWVWDDDFAAEVEGWGTPPADWRDRWAPRNKEFRVEYTRFDIKQQIGSPTVSRLVFAGGDFAESPWLWRVRGPKNETTGYFYGYFLPPVGCEEDSPYMDGSLCDEDSPPVPPCCEMWIDLDFYEKNMISSEDIAYATWNNISVVPQMDYFVDYQYLEYQMGPNTWKDTGWGEYSTNPEVYFHSFGPVIPTELGPTDVVVVLKDGRQIDLTFEVKNIESMPTVPAMTKRGKKPRYVRYKEDDDDDDDDDDDRKRWRKKGWAKCKNLTARELNGALIIQWAVPDDALTRPDMKLRIYVGDSWGLENGTFGRDTFIFLDCPVQTGTVEVPEEYWQPFKEKMQAMQRPFVYVAGMYRFQSRYEMPETGWLTRFHNRGYFEFIEFPIH